MYSQVDKPTDNKSRVVTNAVNQKKSKGTKSFGIVDNRPKTVSQLVTYKKQEYSLSSGNISTFKDVANNDLALLADENQPRDVNRDNDMLNIIAKSDRNIETAERLKYIIDPTGKDYQTSIENELKYIRPEVMIINDATANAKKETFLDQGGDFDKDSANLSKISVDGKMDKVIGSVNKINSIVQWQKIGGIHKNADAVKNTTKNISDFFDKDGDISGKSKLAFPKKINNIKTYSEEIIKTASSIESKLKQSGDEQYLRGGVGNKADEAGGSHLIIGKKLDTFKLEKEQDKSSGILKASVWSGGVNDAFIEGGIDDRKEFRLISDVPPPIEKALRDGDYENFVLLAQEWGQSEKLKSESEREKPTEGGDSKEPVWWAIWDTRKDALTTLSKELVKLMKAGYVLV
ncbi:hypothetical protein [Pectobacterium versatile]|uniref:hypothetical protein n=1 Tax=Pectobacterium versatile TaxID=2488639 RepID=UPI00102EF310|nr:hypothetical protein [Pectobacterium versatile]TAI81177.1 hypothetical protein EG330_18120 [Pectobacterium versatile]